MVKLYLIIVLTLITSTVSAQVVHNFTIYFKENIFEISEEAQIEIDSVLNLMTNTPKAYGINIVGHTDNVGNAYTNKNLSLQRASSTANYFAAKGFLKDKISYSGAGLSRPIDNNNTEVGKANNRRVDITIQVDLPLTASTISSEQFKNIKSQNKRAKHTFMVEEIPTLTDKDDLKEVL